MNNLIIATLTFVLLPAIASTANAKTIKNKKNEIVVKKINFTEDLINSVITSTEDEIAVIDVDYIIHEDGKPYITYINSASTTAKEAVVKFIESATYNLNITPEKLYSIKLTLNQ